MSGKTDGIFTVAHPQFTRARALEFKYAPARYRRPRDRSIFIYLFIYFQHQNYDRLPTGIHL